MHFLRNVLAHVPKGLVQMVAAVIRTIFVAPDAAGVAEQLTSVAERLERQFPVVAAMLSEAAPELTAFAAFPAAHWRKLWSTNPLERVNKEIKRRRNVVRHLPQRGGGHPPGRGGAARDPRRVADRRASLPVRGLDGAACAGRR